MNSSPLYGASPAYDAALDALLRSIGATIDRGIGRRCVDKLHDRRHRCHHNYDQRNWWGIDHDVWLRWPDGTRAVLAQPYPDGVGTADLTSTRDRHGLTVVEVGPAPYGHGTVGYLITGRDHPMIGGAR